MMALFLENFKKEFGLDKPKDPNEVSDLEVISKAVYNTVKSVNKDNTAINEAARKVIERL